MRSTTFIVLLGLVALVAMTANYGLSPRSVSAASVADVDTGGRHTCALVEIPGSTPDYGVKCWGDNAHGQLGDGTQVDRTGPVKVCAVAPCSSNAARVLSGVAAVSAGGGPGEDQGGHTCVLTNTGGVKCWGLNDHGQLGDGSDDDRTAPVDVVGLSSGVAAIATGGFHSCALTTGGGVKCWGRDAEGQLGNGTNNDSNVPNNDSNVPVDVCADEACSTSLANAAVPDESSLPTIDAGGKHTCVLTSAGGVLCWGDNSSGQLGIGTTIPMSSNTPLPTMSLMSGVITLAAGGEHTCARADDDILKCWGLNKDGRLGGEEVELNMHTVPRGVCAVGTEGTCMPITGPFLRVLSVSAGGHHTCAKTPNNEVVCWGLNEQGQVGDGSPSSQEFRPKEVCTNAICSDTLSSTDVVSAGGQHSCGATFAGTLYCWGWNREGQLGVGSNDDSSFALEVSALKPFVIGDANCDGVVNSVDALVILQFDAGLTDLPACPDHADVNGDGLINSLDAVLILQCEADLYICELPEPAEAA